MNEEQDLNLNDEFKNFEVNESYVDGRGDLGDFQMNQSYIKMSMVMKENMMESTIKKNTSLDESFHSDDYNNLMPNSIRQ